MDVDQEKEEEFKKNILKLKGVISVTKKLDGINQT